MVAVVVVVCEPIPRPVATARSMTRPFRSLPTMGAMLDIARGVYYRRKAVISIWETMERTFAGLPLKG